MSPVREHTILNISHVIQFCLIVAVLGISIYRMQNSFLITSRYDTIEMVIVSPPFCLARSFRPLTQSQIGIERSHNHGIYDIHRKSTKPQAIFFHQSEFYPLLHRSRVLGCRNWTSIHECGKVCRWLGLPFGLCHYRFGSYQLVSFHKTL